MRSLLLTLTLLGAAAPQDPADTIRSLVEKMREEDIAVADQAQADLVRIGPSALASLREIARKHDGDLKLRLESVIRKIERSEKMTRAVGTLPRVTVRAKDRPVAEVLSQLQEQSGVKIEGRDLPADTCVSLEVDRLLIWKAIDELCRSHGRLMYTFTPKRVLIKAAPYRELPHVCEKGFFFFLDSIDWTRTMQGGGSHSYMHLQGAVVCPPGSRPFAGALEMAEFEDDKDTNLMQQQQGFGFFSHGYGGSQSQDPDSLLLPLSYTPQVPPAEAAGAFAKFRGKVTLKLALDMKKTLSIKNPLEQSNTSEKAGKNALLIKTWRRTANSLKLELAVTTSWSGEDRLWGAAGSWRLVVRDAQGNAISGRSEHRGSSSYGGSDGTHLTQNISMTFGVAEGTGIASLDWLEPADIVEIILPFDFKGISLK